MKKYLFLGLMVFVGCAKREGWSVTIKGNIKFPDTNGSVYLQQLTIYGVPQGNKHMLTVDRNGAFNITLDIEEPNNYRLNCYNRQQVDFVIDHSDLEIEVDGSKQVGFVDIKGSPEKKLLQQITKLVRESEYSSRAKALAAEMQDATLSKDRVGEITEEYVDLIYQGYDKAAALLEQQGPSVQVVVILLQGWLTYDRYPNLYAQVAKKLQKQWPHYTVTADFTAFFKKLQKLGVGQPAPEIALPDRDGNIVKLSSFRGKYVLVDFWAEWCAPCRRENPNVVRMYHRYHDKGFEVFGVSLGKNKEKWLRAVSDDGLVWTQVSDFKSFESPVVDVYQINAIPSSVLVDPDGLILAKGLSGKRLSKRLHTLFKN